MIIITYIQFVKKVCLILLIGLTFISKPVFSQETIVLTQTIRGQVVDKETQMTLPGATVIVLETDPLKATITNNPVFLMGYLLI